MSNRGGNSSETSRGPVKSRELYDPGPSTSQSRQQRLFDPGGGEGGSNPPRANRGRKSGRPRDKARIDNNDGNTRGRGRGSLGAKRAPEPVTVKLQRREQPAEASKNVDTMPPAEPTATPSPSMKKASSSSTPSSVVFLGPTFAVNEASKSMTSDKPGKEFLVVGILGNTGVGKSKIMSLLHGSNTPAFEEQSMDHIVEGTYCTTGVNMAISSERVILLDTQPIMSTAVLDKAIRNDLPMPPGCTSYEQAVYLQSIQLAAFLFGVCDVVIAADDFAIDTEFLQFLWVAEQLYPVAVSSSNESLSRRSARPAHPDTSMSAANKKSGEFVSSAELVFIFNNSDGPSSVSQFSESHSNSISNYLRHSKMIYQQTSSSVYHEDGDADGKIPRIYYIPTESQSPVGPDADDEEFYDQMSDMIYKILSSPRRQSGIGSERDWWSMAKQIWSNIMHSDAILEYTAEHLNM